MKLFLTLSVSNTVSIHFKAHELPFWKLWVAIFLLLLCLQNSRRRRRRKSGECHIIDGLKEKEISTTVVPQFHNFLLERREKYA